MKQIASKHAVAAVIPQYFVVVNIKKILNQTASNILLFVDVNSENINMTSTNKFFFFVSAEMIFY